jgi:hypothetical protein
MVIRTLRPPIVAGPEGMLRAAGSTGAAWGREALIYILPLDRDRMQRLPTGVPAEVTALAFAPGGDRLAIGYDGQAGIAIFNFVTSEIVTALPCGAERLADPQCRAVRQHDLDAAIGFGRHIARQRRRQRLGCGEHPHRQEGRLAHQLPAPLGVPPLPQQAPSA